MFSTNLAFSSAATQVFGQSALNTAAALPAVDPQALDAKEGPEKAATQVTAIREAESSQVQLPNRDISDTWRTQLDPETLKQFTVVLDPATREVLYTVPATGVSEEALQESRELARYERNTRARGDTPQHQVQVLV